MFIRLIQGKYGEHCQQECLCKNGGQCDPITGSCRCPPGVKGDQCEDGCTPGQSLNLYKSML